MNASSTMFRSAGRKLVALALLALAGIVLTGCVYGPYHHGYRDRGYYYDGYRADGDHRRGCGAPHCGDAVVASHPVPDDAYDDEDDDAYDGHPGYDGPPGGGRFRVCDSGGDRCYISSTPYWNYREYYRRHGYRWLGD